MATRQIKDAKDLTTNELIYFKGHAKATYMSDGTTVEEAVNSKQDTLLLEVKDNGNIVLSPINGQSKEFMPATPSGDPMHYAYVAAGAEYNDTGADVTKTAPWGDTVTHKAGYWYLNGLGDLTNEEMVEIYNWGYYLVSVQMLYAAQAQIPCRTNIMNCRYVSNGNLTGVIQQSQNLEVAVLRANDGEAAYTSTLHAAFYNDQKLRFIATRIWISNGGTVGTNPFNNCPKLEYVKVGNLPGNISFPSSSLLRIECVLYMIEKAKSGSTVIITLHADAYARAMANTDIVAALEANTNITLASA